ncbi:MAG: DUF4255 domain-containing protein [Acidimicrobiia bacterium]|nr:DUF4255 domain-containing protein [Acidimicrobiia bacterium]
MIHEADEALRSYLTSWLPAGAKQAISFDAPNEEWVKGIKTPTLDLFLYDLAENMDARAGDWIELRDEKGLLVALQPPVRRYELTYIVSAWGGTVADQHALLGALLQSMPAYDDIPFEHLTGRLEEQGIAVRLRIGSLDGIPDLWSALGQTPVTALALALTLPVLPPQITDLAPPASSIDLGLAGQDGAPGRKPIPSFDEEPGSAPMRGDDGKEGRLPDLPTEPLPDPDPGAVVPVPANGDRKWTAYRTRETISVKKATKRPGDK